MKKSLFSFAIACALLASCSDNKEESVLSIQDSNIEVSTSLAFNFPGQAAPAKSSSARVMRADGKDVTKIDAKAVILEHAYHAANGSITDFNWVKVNADGKDAVADVRVDVIGGTFALNGLKLGYHSFRSEYTNLGTLNSAGIPTAWQEIKNNQDLNNSIYKRFVGITRGVSTETDAANMNSINDANIVTKSTADSNFAFDFVPQASTFPYGTTPIKAKSFLIDIDNLVKETIAGKEVIKKDSKDSKQAIFNKNIIMEMTPANSIIDMKLTNNCKNTSDIYVGVYADGKLYFVAPNVGSKRVILNTLNISAGKNLSCKLFTFRLKAGNLPINGGVYSEADINTNLQILNKDGNGVDLFAKMTVVGNQRYYVNCKNDGDDKTKDDDQKDIVVNDDNYKSFANLLIFTHNNMNDNGVTVGGDILDL